VVTTRKQRRTLTGLRSVGIKMESGCLLNESSFFAFCDCTTRSFSGVGTRRTGTSTSSYTASAQHMSKKQSLGECNSCSSRAFRQVTSKSTSRNELSKIHIGCEGSIPTGPGDTGAVSGSVGLEGSCVSVGLGSSPNVSTGRTLSADIGGVGGWKESIGVGERGGSGCS
jgi:hypothetical protein